MTLHFTGWLTSDFAHAKAEYAIHHTQAQAPAAPRVKAPPIADCTCRGEANTWAATGRSISRTLAFGKDPVTSRRVLAVPPCERRLVSSAAVMCRRNCLRDRVDTYDGRFAGRGAASVFLAAHAPTTDMQYVSGSCVVIRPVTYFCHVRVMPGQGFIAVWG